MDIFATVENRSKLANRKSCLTKKYYHTVIIAIEQIPKRLEAHTNFTKRPNNLQEISMPFFIFLIFKHLQIVARIKKSYCTSNCFLFVNLTISLLNLLHAQSFDAQLTRCEDVAASFIARHSKDFATPRDEPIARQHPGARCANQNNKMATEDVSRHAHLQIEAVLHY